jgi:hypothetical protein
MNSMIREQRLAFLINEIGLEDHESKDLILTAMEKAFDEGIKVAELLVAQEMSKALIEPAWLAK